MGMSRLHRTANQWTDASWAALGNAAPRFSFGWRGFYFAYFFAYANAGPSPHARRRSTA